MKVLLHLLASLLLLHFLQNEAFAKSQEAAQRTEAANDEGHFDPMQGEVDLKSMQIDHDELAEIEHDDKEEESDVPKSSPGWGRRRRRRRRRRSITIPTRRCITFYRRRYKFCFRFHG